MPDKRQSVSPPAALIGVTSSTSEIQLPPGNTPTRSPLAKQNGLDSDPTLASARRKCVELDAVKSALGQVTSSRSGSDGRCQACSNPDLKGQRAAKHCTHKPQFLRSHFQPLPLANS